jgi:radical SAM superfamily enzyme YgiQ (UPF0313 family)
MRTRIAFICPSPLLLPEDDTTRRVVPLADDYWPPLSLMGLVSHLKQNAPELELAAFDLSAQYSSPDDLARVIRDSKAKRDDVQTLLEDLGEYHKSTRPGIVRQFVSDLFRFDPDVVAIPFNYSSTYGIAKNAVRIVKQHVPAAQIVVGGAHATALPRELLEELPEVDVLVLGEAEPTLLELLKRTTRGTLARSAEGITGLHYRAPSGIVSTGYRDYETQLDQFPHPYLAGAEFSLEKRLQLIDLLPEFFELIGTNMIGKLPHERTACLLTSRGCPFRCEFCTNEALTDRKMRYHSIDFVVDALHYLKREYRVERISFSDAIFSVNKQRMRDLSAAVSDLGFSFYCQTRLDCVDEERVACMKAMGFHSVALGIESFNPKSLSAVAKALNLPRSLARVRLFPEHEILTVGTFIVGLPEESAGSILNNAYQARKVGLDKALFFPLVAVPGTKVQDNLIKRLPVAQRQSLGPMDPHEYWYTAELDLETLQRLASASYALFRGDEIDTDLYLAMAQAMHEAGLLEDAVAMLREALGHRPDDRALQSALAEALERASVAEASAVAAQ